MVSGMRSMKLCGSAAAVTVNALAMSAAQAILHAIVKVIRHLSFVVGVRAWVFSIDRIPSIARGVAQTHRRRRCDAPMAAYDPVPQALHTRAARSGWCV